MNKNIVIFGCDNSGKTTLGKALEKEISKHYNVEYKHSLGPKATKEEQMEFMTSNMEKDCITIFDRFPFIEEGVCGKILRNKSIYETEDKDYDRAIEERLLKDVDIFIMCYPGIFNVVNWGDREQMYGIKENIVSLIRGYNMLAINLKNLGYNIIEYNYKYNSVEEVLEEIFKEG